MVDMPAHVVVVVEENHGNSSIIGSADAPFINSLAAQGVLFANYSAITHPSQPNYLAMFSGSTQGVTDDKHHSLNAPTLAGQLAKAGLTFTGFTETHSPRKHNPWESFAESKDGGRSFSEFPADFTRLPTVSFVIPDLDNDMHNGSVAEGDAWLKRNLAAYAAWAETHNSLLIVTFDEAERRQDNKVPTIVVGAGVSHKETEQAVDHYSLLHTIETFFNLPALGEAAQAPLLQLNSKS